MNLDKTIPAVLRSEIAFQKMTLAELSDKTGISPTQLSRKISVERNKITLSELATIASALGTTGADIMTKAEERAGVDVA